MEQITTQQIANKLEKEYAQFNVQPIPGEIEVLKIVVEDCEEFPIFVSINNNEVTCISYLFKQNEIKNDLENEMHKVMLKMNLSLPLSSFSIIEDQYVLFGSLSTKSNVEEVICEIETLYGNTIEAIETMQNYLK